MNEKGAVQQQTSTPSSSVNNSMNSLQGGGTATPSPEQVNGRRGLTSDQAQDLPVSTHHEPPFRARRIQPVGSIEQILN